MSLLPVELAHRLTTGAEPRRWLITGLWTEEAVGIVGGEPKCCKSFLALDLAVSVASGTPCLRRFPVTQPGRVLLYAAEDAPHLVRRRLEGICTASGVQLQALDIQVITAASLRLDLEADCSSLEETVAALKPRLLVLDPFVRLHRIDENASAEVVPLLAYLRQLQRRYRVAVAVVHHAKKGAARLRAGQALRGSSEFHAWGDSNLYLRRHADSLTLSVEHRAAPSLSPISLALAGSGDSLALALVEPAAAPEEPKEASAPSVDQRITEALAAAGGFLSVTKLRAVCRLRNATFYSRLAALSSQGVVARSDGGYRLATS